MVTLTSTIFTYYIASDIILKKTVRQSQETVRQMSENYENFMQGIYDKINYIAYSATTQEELCYGEKGAYEEGYFSRERELKRQMVRLFNSFYVDDLQIYAKNGKDYYFSVKTIIPFNSHGGSGFSNTIEEIKKLQPNATVKDDGLSISRNDVADSEQEITDWAKGFQ